MNNSGYVAKDKRERVLAVAQELDYVPSPIAVSLKKRKTRQILFYIRDFTNLFYLEMYEGMLEYIRPTDYNVIVSGQLNKEQITTLMIDAAILPFEDQSFLSKVNNQNIPVVTLGIGEAKMKSSRHIDTNVRDALKIAVDYVKSNGHTSIAFAAMDIDHLSELRIAAFLDCCGSAARLIGPTNQQSLEDLWNYFEGGVFCAERFLELPVRPSAVICFNDDVALGFMGRIQSAGLRIPADVSVVGIDGHKGGLYVFPQLTTVSLQPKKLGEECARAAVLAARGESTERIVRINPELLIRSSVAQLDCGS